jgi:hypothetical protein
MFFNRLKLLIQKSPNDCFFILEDFYIDILDDKNHKNNKQQLIYGLKSQFKNITTKARSQLYHI